MNSRALIALIAVVVLAALGAVAAQETQRVYLPALRDSRPSPTPTASATITAVPTATYTPTATPTATTIPTVTPSPTATRVPPQLVPNGGFETGRDPWIFDANRFQGGAYSGEWSAQLGTVLGSSIRQDVTVPSSQPFLVFWNQRTSLSNTCNVTGRVLVNGTTVAAYTDFCQSQRFFDWRRERIDLSAFAGQTVTLAFTMPREEETDPDDPGLSAWYLDEVAFDAP
jgi:hypothetical protein